MNDTASAVSRNRVFFRALRDVYQQAYPDDPKELTHLLQNMNLTTGDGVLNLAGLLLFAERPGQAETGWTCQGRSLGGVVMIGFSEENTVKQLVKEKLRREEIPEIPEVALREAVVNAVCHRDYFEKGAHVMIEIFCRIRVSQDFPPKASDKKLEETTQEINGTTQETTQEIILALIKINPAITRKELAEKIGITPNGIKYHLDKLRKQGVIRHSGATKKGCWELVEDDD
jgi:predicted HTH transcriptional regulator